MKTPIRLLVALAVLSSLALLPAAAQAAKAKPYYLALGDSLSVGVQPNASGGNKNTSQGYANSSPRTSQLATAERFPRRNSGKVRFVTIDIGANDVASCGQGGAIDIDCVNKGIAAIKKNGPKIAKRLRRAAGRNVPMAVMTLYNPFLQQWLNGGSAGVVLEVANGA